jgi:hypothetical protein
LSLIGENMKSFHQCSTLLLVFPSTKLGVFPAIYFANKLLF